MFDNTIDNQSQNRNKESGFFSCISDQTHYLRVTSTNITFWQDGKSTFEIDRSINTPKTTINDAEIDNDIKYCIKFGANDDQSKLVTKFELQYNRKNDHWEMNVICNDDSSNNNEKPDIQT